MIISQISLMLVRNFFYILATCHWFACIIYFIGKAEVVGGMDSWLSRPVAAARFEGFPPIVAYVNTIYLSINLFAGLGDADFYVATWIEALVTSAYLLFNVVLGAYILGTVTMLMVKGDERIKVRAACGLRLGVSAWFGGGVVASMGVRAPVVWSEGMKGGGGGIAGWQGMGRPGDTRHTWCGVLACGACAQAACCAVGGNGIAPGRSTSGHTLKLAQISRPFPSLPPEAPACLS
eukprot:365299-Chlamydomonas_euryale.AAC.5